MATIFGKFGGSENINGTASNDSIFPYTGFDLIDGGAGLDTVNASLQRSQALVSKRDGLFYLDVVSGASGISNTEWRMKNVERIAFDDGGIALDLGVDQAAGKAALLIGAAAGKALLANQSVAGLIIRFFDNGASLLDGANALVNSGIMAGLAGGSSNAALVTLVVKNVLDVTPSAAVVAELSSLLDNNTFTQGSFLAAVAGLEINQEHIKLVGLQESGLLFL